jgi:hypothetical protein
VVRLLALVSVGLLAIAGCEVSDVSRQLGARCDDSSECDDRCLLPGPDWPGGFCTRSCDDGDDCPIDAACAEDAGGVCLFSCARDPDCAFLGARWTCQARLGRPGGTVMVCRGA